MNDYKKLLERARKNLPEKALTTERFEIPKAQGHVQGSKTIITNFNQICSILHREPKQILKYLQKELAAPAQIEGPRLILGRKLPSGLINQKIEKFAKDFVICPECGKPDTQLSKQERITIMKCMACGARHPIKAKI